MNEPRKRGRPKKDDASALRGTVTVCLPIAIHERLIRLARRRSISLSGLVRAIISTRTHPIP